MFLNLHETNFFKNVTYFVIISRKNVMIVFHSQMVMSEKPVRYTTIAVVADAAAAGVGLLLLLQLVAPSLES